jgi:hypothetical protein
MQATQPRLTVQITANVEWITPELARQYLGNKAPNRHISKRRVKDYARDIKAGNWGLTGETMIFDNKGQLIEGQHRCEAIIEADEGIWTLVVRGVDAAEFVRINSGKPRTMADTLGIRGDDAPSTLAAAMRLLYHYEHGTLTLPFPPRPTRDELLDEASHWPSLTESLQVKSWCRKLLTPGATVFFHFLFARADNEKANTFFFKLGEGADLPKVSPIYQLRERLLGAKLDGQKLLPVEQYALLIKAWNAYDRHQEMKRLTWSTQEAFPKVAGLTQ